MVWEGLDAVKTGRAMLGATNPLASNPGLFRCFYDILLVDHITTLLGTIRGDFALAVGRNICHGSDAVESAEAEIKLCVQALSRDCPVPNISSSAGSLRELFSTRVLWSLGSLSDPILANKRTLYLVF